MFRVINVFLKKRREQQFHCLSHRLGIRFFIREKANIYEWFRLHERSIEEAVMHAYLYEVAHRIQIADHHDFNLKAIKLAVEEDAIPLFRQWNARGKISNPLFNLNLNTLECMITSEC
jgi:hypothetical protein